MRTGLKAVVFKWGSVEHYGSTSTVQGFHKNLNKCYYRQYRTSLKECPGALLKFSLPGEADIRGGCLFTNLLLGGRLFHFVDIQTQSFPIDVSTHINATYDETGNRRKWESVKKLYQNGKVEKQYKEKGYKTMSILSHSSISISLQSGVA